MKHQLDFEKPIVELEHKLDELKKHPERHSLDVSFEEEVAMIQKKLEETKRRLAELELEKQLMEQRNELIRRQME